MNFKQAAQLLILGFAIRRKSWANPDSNLNIENDGDLWWRVGLTRAMLGYSFNPSDTRADDWEIYATKNRKPVHVGEPDEELRRSSVHS